MLDKKNPIYLFIYIFSLISHRTALVNIDLVFENRVKDKCHKWLIGKFPFKIIYYLVWETCFNKYHLILF